MLRVYKNENSQLQHDYVTAKVGSAGSCFRLDKCVRENDCTEEGHLLVEHGLLHTQR